MNVRDKETLRVCIQGLLEKKRRPTEFSDSDSLFISAKLDSFSMMKLIMELEVMFGIDFSRVDFDVSLIDSIDDIVRLVDSN